jgi:hypothetical protein
LYVTAFVQPISGETFWYERGVEAVLRRAAGAVCARGRGAVYANVNLIP